MELGRESGWEIVRPLYTLLPEVPGLGVVDGPGERVEPGETLGRDPGTLGVTRDGLVLGRID